MLCLLSQHKQCNTNIDYFIIFPLQLCKKKLPNHIITHFPILQKFFLAIFIHISKDTLINVHLQNRQKIADKSHQKDIQARLDVVPSVFGFTILYIINCFEYVTKFELNFELCLICNKTIAVSRILVEVLYII